MLFSQQQQVGEVRPDIQPYCRVASATEPFGARYDLIVCIEVLEHMTEDEGRRAIANIAESAGDVLFSSTPDDFTEPTHVNVRPRSWWVDRFAEHGLALDPDYDAGFVAPHALRFRAASEVGRRIGVTGHRRQAARLGGVARDFRRREPRRRSTSSGRDIALWKSRRS